MLASEATPFAKTGGLADVAGALTKQLHATGHDVRLVMPLHAQVDRAAHGVAPVAGFTDLSLEFGPHRFQWSLHSAPLPRSGARTWFIEIPALFQRGTLYGDGPDEHLRFIAFTRAALELCQRWGWAPEVLHCNDWHTAFAPLLLKTAYAWDRLFAPVRTVMTIHNIGYQGVFGAAQASDLGIGAADLPRLHQDDLRAGKVNALKHGILYADAITTVSPTYAQEIMTAQYGMGLEDVLRQRAAQVHGILNGVDYDDWDPRHDRWLPRHFDAGSLEVKATLKAELMQRLRARIKVENPNDRELAVKGITYTIEVGGEEFGRGISGSSFTVPRLGEAEFDMNVTANMAGTLMRLAQRAKEAGRTPDSVDYRIVGKVSLATGMLRSIPFEERGAFKLR